MKKKTKQYVVVQTFIVMAHDTAEAFDLSEPTDIPEGLEFCNWHVVAEGQNVETCE